MFQKWVSHMTDSHMTLIWYEVYVQIWKIVELNNPLGGSSKASLIAFTDLFLYARYLEAKIKSDTL